MNHHHHHHDQDPYKIMGVPPDASPELIKSAFSEAALKIHQACNTNTEKSSSSSQEECREAAQQFSRISNAYRLLSDPKQKQQYDNYYNRTSSSRTNDPFSRWGDDGRVVVDPLERFFGGSGGIFGGSGVDRMFQDAFEEMRRMQDQQQSGDNSKGGDDNNNRFFSSSSSRSSTSYQNKNGEHVTEVTTTRRVNGKAETVKERIIRKADGTVERQIETNDDEPSSLPTITSMQRQQKQQQRPSMIDRQHPFQWRPADDRSAPEQQAQQNGQQQWGRRFGLTPEQRAQLDDDDDDVPATTTTTPFDESNKKTEPKKKSWSWW